MSEETITLEAADLKPLVDEVDHRFAGESLDPWLGYVPEESLKSAIEVAADRIGSRIIAFVVPRELRGDFSTFVERQRRAGKAFVADHYPHLRVTFRTVVAPFRGIGSDMRVFYVVVGNEK